jgi:hypothetical protein
MPGGVWAGKFRAVASDLRGSAAGGVQAESSPPGESRQPDKLPVDGMAKFLLQ